jgi:hypothetical protein
VPDVIDGTEDDNDALLASWPADIRGVPVYHLHESLDRLDFLCTRWPTVALGSSGQWPTPGTRAAIIAERIEAFQSSPIWRPSKQRDLFTLE